MNAATRRAQAAAAKAAASAAARARRALRIDQYARGQTGVWFYQVDIEVRVACVHPEPPTNNGIFLDACVEDDVQYYSVRRRYNEFLQLYDKIKELLADLQLYGGCGGANGELPPFPQKEIIPPSVLSLLWRVSSSSAVLEERRCMFETLLRWIEAHPALRHSTAFVEFLGRPPQSLEGYVSLKEYSSQHWLSSLEQLTKDKEKRRRRTSSDCSSCSVLTQEQTRRTKKRRQDDAVQVGVLVYYEAVSAKRQRRRVGPKSPKAQSQSLATQRKKKRSRPRSEKAESCGTPQRQLSLPLVETESVAQVESSPMHKRKKTIE